ncbi:MAG: valine--tRNA ligase [Oscillospiraceae bacterium]|nr:valine--tRNA ligase [Oscillospiraceae bacterium]
MAIKKELAKTYSPADIEERIYNFWNDNGYFTPEISDEKTFSINKRPFSIVIPPPNVTGNLHIGHALNNTLQDIIIRTKRMQGYSALWLPGTDHAGIATQIKVEEMLRKTMNTSRHDIGREKFLEYVWDWKAKYGGNIINQLKKLGSSCDWTRERFTMDENLSAAVKKTFVALYNKGLIYRGLRIINWCPDCITALSDAEVEHKELDGSFWYINYPLKDSSEFVTIATTRPETMLGDTGVAINPNDERYQHLIGKTLVLPLLNREIPIIADDYVDKDFGTGCVKVTPCHDPNDFDMGTRHDLAFINILDDNAKINKNGGQYCGMDRYEARKQIVIDLKELGLLVKTESHSHNVAHCYRCDTVVEPIASKQWFVKMKPLAEPAIKAVKDGDVKFIPDRFSKIYLNWMENIHDWCISRQLWWGHRIPAYYCLDCGNIMVSENDVNSCLECNSHNIKQDEDVLDTWFSSALWPFSTLGWPNVDDADLKYYYPTSVLVTGYDIITFWVSKMIFMGLEFMEQNPFPYVFINGLVRDAYGKKMSKSSGNVVDPLDIIDKYGTDALRFSLLTGNTPGNDMRFSDDKIESARNFNNKIWNAARFVLMNVDIEEITLPENLALEDKWILSLYNNLVLEVTNNIENYELGIALGKLYDFIWDNFCDWYIELLKPRFANNDINAQKVIVYVLSNTLKLLHPFMPFITEELWQSLPHEGESIMISEFPQYNESLLFPEDEECMDKLIAAIKAIRIRRAEMNVPPSKKTKIFIVTDKRNIYNERTFMFFEKLAWASSVEVCESYEDENAIQIITDTATIYIPFAEMIDIAKELDRLAAERNNTLKEITRLESKLNNEGFTSKAPVAVVEGEKIKLNNYKETLSGIEKAIEKIQK